MTHSRDEVYRACKRLLIMDAGQAVCKGETKKIFEKPEYFYAARVTGCKNLSPARRISDHELEALDWGVRLKTADPVSADTSFVEFGPLFLRSRARTEGGKRVLPGTGQGIGGAF